MLAGINPPDRSVLDFAFSASVPLAGRSSPACQLHFSLPLLRHTTSSSLPRIRGVLPPHCLMSNPSMGSTQQPSTQMKGVEMHITLGKTRVRPTSAGFVMESKAGTIFGRWKEVGCSSTLELALGSLCETEMNRRALGWSSIDALLAEVTVVDDEIVPQGAM